MSLTGDEQQKVVNGLMRYWSMIWEIVGVNKVELAMAVSATDDWIEDEQSAYNQALPQAARDNLSLEQKTLLFCAVACARVSMAFLRRVFGEVD